MTERETVAAYMYLIILLILLVLGFDWLHPDDE